MSRNAISSDDPQAVDKLELKLEAMLNQHEMMKTANAYFREHGTLKGCEGITDERAATFESTMPVGSKPFPDYVLTSNLQEIRRIQNRIEEIKTNREVGFIGWQFEGGEVEANTEMNRLQVFFDEKPTVDVIMQMKSNGFKWSPRQGAWQRQLTSNAIYSADRIDAIKPLSGELPSRLQPKRPVKPGPER